MSGASAPLGPYAPQRPRRGGLRWMVVGIGLVIVSVGAVVLLGSLYPRSFGLSRPFAYPYGGGFLGLFLVVWGCLLLVRVAWWSARWAMRGPGRGRSFDPAILAARQRYARGEITREQFHQLVRDLRQPPGPPLP